ncbi:peptide ABC transporter substrate-binding protein [Kushneria indalinina]|uniref:Oligopeptide transport system substrate-binding protein n=1 Tax=Kushneria indalinina DSM 14324 TaxID=1122140 RepID=A0A3D9DTQ8_9GAMM|nr:peptide ABC transporter substrate-binding protein [Kushneria indalinina]REC94025.1 oligopeptide transport system substrate-binding protein [Kushneria indalinina DSM 14324]
MTNTTPFPRPVRHHSLFKRAALTACLLTIAPLSMAATLRIDNGAEPGTLDPQKTSGVWETRIVRELFETLVSQDATGELVAGLASRWDLSDDGLTWTFELRDDAQWSDGEPITAGDAVFSLRRLLRPETTAHNANLYYPIENARAINAGEAAPETLGARALDDHHLEIQLERPTAWFLQAIAMPEAAPLPEHVLREQDERWVIPGRTVVSGAFTLSEWSPQDHITLEKNPQFYAADDVALDEAIFYPLEEASAALNRFRTGALDISYTSVPGGRFEQLRRELGETLRVNPMVAEYFYMFNLRPESPLSDIRVREALNLATRREVITDQLLGMGQTPSYWLVPRVTAGGAEGALPTAQMAMDERMARARELMQAAGFGPNNPLTLTLRYNTLEDHKKIAVALAAMWKPLGVDVALINTEAASHYAAIREGDFQLARYGMVATIDDPYDFLGSYTTGGSSALSSGYHNADYDRLVEQSSETIDPSARAELLTRAQQHLLDDYALLPLYDYVNTALVSERVHGWAPTPMDVHPLRYISLEE